MRAARTIRTTGAARGSGGTTTIRCWSCCVRGPTTWARRPAATRRSAGLRPRRRLLRAAAGAAATAAAAALIALPLNWAAPSPPRPSDGSAGPGSRRPATGVARPGAVPGALEPALGGRHARGVPALRDEDAADGGTEHAAHREPGAGEHTRDRAVGPPEHAAHTVGVRRHDRHGGTLTRRTLIRRTLIRH
nr:hypothetical protein [Streptomyces sp. alain-838]